MDSANDRLKKGWDGRLWTSMIVAVVAHFAVFQAWPTMTAAQLYSPAAAFETLAIPDVEVPPAPEAIARPAAPIAAANEVPVDVTIERQDWQAPTVAPPPPSSSDRLDAVERGAGFTPYTVAPTIANRDEVARVLDREYPTALKQAGIGGVVRVAFHIDERGRVLETRIDESSGYARLDAAAERVADVMRFTPALNRERAVSVWVALPIVFEVR